jgi:predicted pyridoxine 5'-phosphate oxidase superfamily flavin-nucleotide-binding protein
MARVHQRIDDHLRGWLLEQPVFFVATAPDDPGGLVNCSPKGNRDELAVLDDHTVAYLDQTGSGAETIAHLRDNGRIVVMFCAFTGKPRIVRLHGRGRVERPGDDGFAALGARFPAAGGVGVRSIIVVDVERIADSCGYGVPLMTLEGHRGTMDSWAERKGADGIEAYQAEHNTKSIDGLAALDAGPPDRR